MEEHVSSTTTDTGDEVAKLQTELGVENAPELDATGVQEDREAVPKSVVDENDILDLVGGALDAVGSHNAEDPHSEMQSSSSGPEPEPATELKAAEPIDSAATLESTEEHTDATEISETAPEPAKEETIPQPEAADTTVQPESDEKIVKPEAPASLAEESPSPASPLSYEPVISSSAPSLPLSSAANVNTPYLQSQDNIKAMDTSSKDLFSSKPSWYETDMLSGRADVEDDFLGEMKASAAPRNPFQDFSPIGDSGSGLPHAGETAPDTGAGKMSESPTPDLVQYAHDSESPEGASSHTEHREDRAAGLTQLASDSAMETSSLSKNLAASPLEPEESSAQPSLPDILKLSPLNPDKLDSGSSEGSPDSMHSPGHGPQVGSHSATNPFNFDSKVLLLKEMAEETEARAAEKKRVEDTESVQEKAFGAFDLVKEAQNTTKDKGLSQVEEEENDWMSSGQDLVKPMEKTEPPNRPESMNLPPSPPPKRAVAEDSDSESPMTDSLSPVLEAMGKNPASFQVEMESKRVEETKSAPGKEVRGSYPEEPEAETSEPEASSEEFEFVERPPKGVIDEFLESLDHSKFAKAQDMGTERDLLSDFGQGKLVADEEPELQDVGSHQSSYLLLTQPASKSSPQKLKSELEKPVAPTEDVKPKVQETPSLSPAPLAHSTTSEPEPLPATKPTAASGTSHPEPPKPASMPYLSTRAVVDLLYWRDIKTTGVVFGASLFLLLSLTVCSIVSVCSYVALALLSVTITFRIYKGILQAVQKSDEGHPFKVYLDRDVALSEDMVHKYSDVALERLNVGIKELRRLFLVEDLVDSLKFAVVMWILTYVGALFNGLTLLILALVGVFSCPVIYEKNQTQIDHYVALVKNQIKDVVGKIQAKVPGMKRKAD
ncbi:reticulon-4-like isoform X1 [Megalops cyprinoides]|uniref:reticulon-4-like isoform X1 n=1 Tax=Megalops cyprinoides TaxID=118141 RepID=UPI00186549A1|nr:reticulon-4-like isoform X1 [Megalops cyprinoides]